MLLQMVLFRVVVLPITPLKARQADPQTDLQIDHLTHHRTDHQTDPSTHCDFDAALQPLLAVLSGLQEWYERRESKAAPTVYLQ